MRRKLFCRHNFKIIARQKNVNEVLSVCSKCGIYNVFHRGISCGFNTRKFPKGHWVSTEDKTRGVVFCKNIQEKN